MKTPSRLLIIADVGGEEVRHLGDEAMLEANLAAFRQVAPGMALTVVCSDPRWTAERFGVDATSLFGFPDGPSDSLARKKMLEGLLAAARSRGSGTSPSQSPLDATSEALFGADGLVVSGGGNLSSTWSHLLCERVALLSLARIFGKPAVLLGQTIGPTLVGDDYQLLSDVLSSVRFVGVRELPSAVLSLKLGASPGHIWYQNDDALLFDEGSEFPIASRKGVAQSRVPVIAVTLDAQLRAAGETVFGSLIAQLRRLSQLTGAPIVLVPHVFGNHLAAGPSDLTEARILAKRLALNNTVVAEGLDARQARQLTSAAALIISSRYHPIVFGLGAGVPSLGIFGDDYCRIKLQGALTHGRLQQWTVSYDAVCRGELLSKALELWRVRDEVSDNLKALSGAWREEYRERWAAIIRALDPDAAIPPENGNRMFGRPVQDVVLPLELARQAEKQWETELRSREGFSSQEWPAGASASAQRSGLLKKFDRYAVAARSKLRRFGL